MTIRRALPQDVPAMHDLIQELATYERAPNEFVLSVEQLHDDGFSGQPSYIAWVAVHEGEVIGMSLCYEKYSTWKGRSLYLEDLIVTESKRGLGAGKLLFDESLEFAKRYKYGRFEWQVLDWNQSAIDFYKRNGAELHGDWINCRITKLE
mgnify:CR=1 FL=1|tara:strand:- start:127 stop:576 length:450 start_codon:yes stop_codon:yes gene_type:complete